MAGGDHRYASKGAAAGAARAGKRPRLERAGTACQAGRLRRRRGHRAPLHPLHVRDHRQAQGRGQRPRRARRGTTLVDEGHLRRRSGRRLLGRLGHGLGGRPLLHRLRSPAGRRDHGRVRGQAGGHAGRRRVLARRRGIRRQGAVHGADGHPCHSPRGSRRRAPEEVRHEFPRRLSTWPENVSIPTRISGRATSSACPWWITGGRPRPAGRSAPTAEGSRSCP